MSNVRERVLFGSMFVILGLGITIAFVGLGGSKSDVITPEQRLPTETQPAGNLERVLLRDQAADQLQEGTAVVPIEPLVEGDRESERLRLDESRKRWRKEQLAHWDHVQRLQEAADKQYAEHMRAEEESAKLYRDRAATIAQAREAERIKMERARIASAKREAARASARAKLVENVQQARATLAKGQNKVNAATGQVARLRSRMQRGAQQARRAAGPHAAAVAALARHQKAVERSNKRLAASIAELRQFDEKAR